MLLHQGLSSCTRDSLERSAAVSFKCSQTCRVGAALLRGEYEEAVRLIMQPREGEREETAEARRLYLDKGGFAVFFFVIFIVVVVVIYYYYYYYYCCYCCYCYYCDYYIGLFICQYVFAS